MPYTTGREFADFIAPVIRQKRYMQTVDVIKYVEENYNLTLADREILDCGVPRWKQMIRNLKCNGVFSRYPEYGVRDVYRGFCCMF